MRTTTNSQAMTEQVSAINPETVNNSYTPTSYIINSARMAVNLYGPGS